MKELPNKKPFDCPRCTYVGRDIYDLTKHYGLSHRVIYSLMQKELGDSWHLAEIDTCECKVCGQVLDNGKLLSDHYCSQHFYQQLATGLILTDS